jgi:membrane peptidoglycan carboxypeptidase
VPFLYNAYGVEMAARTYFDKSADELDVLDAATLVGMLKGNSYYNPVLNPERALQRRNTVLAQMVKYGKLSAAQFAQLQRRPLRIDFERQKEPPGPAPHFAQQLRKWLIGWADRNDYNIYSDGLIVRTTIDSRLQQIATQALTQQANQLQGIANNAWSGRRLRHGQRGVSRLHARVARIQGGAGRRQERRGRDEAARGRPRLHARAVQGQDRRAGRLRRHRSARRADSRVGRQPRFHERAVRSRRRRGVSPARRSSRSYMAPRSRAG